VNKRVVGKPFTGKGDPRNNLKGRPKAFDALREIAQTIARESVTANGQTMEIAEVILRQWAVSKEFQKQKGFMEIAFGKVPDDVNIDATGDITFTWRKVKQKAVPDDE
jgi:hypothetical protein